MITKSMPLYRRRAFLLPVVALLVLVLAWWFAWMAPEGSKLAAIKQQQVAAQQEEVQLNLKLEQLKAEAKQVKAAAPFLKRFSQAIPSAPSAPDLVVAVYNLAVQDGVSLQSITDDTVQATTSGYSTIPVALSATGPHDSLLAFVQGLYGLTRLLTLQSVALAGSGNLNSSSSANYSATISATAYTTYLPKPTASS